jgi:pilus assembly protein Flp/PilA
MKKQVMTFLKDEEGLTIVEYAVAGGLIAAGAIVAFTELGTQVTRIITFLGAQLGLVDTTGAA